KKTIRNNNWRIIHETHVARRMSWNIHIEEKEMYFRPYGDISLFIRSFIKQGLFPKGLLNELSQTFDSSTYDVDNLNFLFVVRRNPNNINKDNELIKYHPDLEKGVEDVDEQVYHPFLNIYWSSMSNDTNAH